jgi:hypothetical protein
MKAQRIRVGDRANPDLAKRAGRAHAMGSNCPASNAALALQASLPQAKTWSCLTRTLSINEANRFEFQREFCHLGVTEFRFGLKS